MKRQDIEHVLRQLGAHTVQAGPEWVQHSCCLAPWTHASGHDSHPSSGVKISEGVSAVHCFGCDYTGGMLDYVNTVGNHLIAEGKMEAEAVQDLMDYVLLSEEEELTEVELRNVSIKQKAVVHEAVLDCLDTYHPYFADRRILKDTAEMYRLGFREKEQRALIPLIAKTGNVEMVMGRLIHGNGSREIPKYKNHPAGVEKQRYLFGEHLLDRERHSIAIVTEGAIDSILTNQTLWKHGLTGFIALAVMGKEASSYQLDELAKFDEVIPLGDNDKPGIMFNRKLIASLRHRTPVSPVEYPPETFEGQFKDPAMLGDRIVDMVQSRMNFLQAELQKRFRQRS